MFVSSKKPFFIAEISANHCGSLSIAKKLIRISKKYGADAVKLQTYTADTMTIKSNNSIFKIKKGIWKGYSLWELYNKAETPLHWHKELFTYAKEIGIKIFSTPFDASSVNFLQKLNCPCYKISSFEITDLPLIKKVALTKKPIIMSTGMANMNEISEAFRVAKKYGSKDITLLYCVSNYPSKRTDFNLNYIRLLKETFKCRVGLSDHSLDIEIAKAAVAAGADVFEKHIACEGKKKGLDHQFSLIDKDIKIFRDAIDKTHLLMGKKYFYRSKEEFENKKYRRSIFATKDIKKGELFTENNIKCLRPKIGVSPKHFEVILGKKSPITIKLGEPIKKKIYLQIK